ncbi:MAG: insulinase family protein [Bdellovibrionaceae bacterium]|nr:insulinase family protein [Pseudobdellovibrionaceae bacterium]
MKYAFLSAVLFCSLAVSAQEKDNLKLNFPVTKYKLSNGLTVLLHEDHSVPLISYHTWYRVGSRDEGPGITGSAHMLEHMMFKGSKKYPGKAFDRLLHENGITNNAFTTYDYTGFYQSLPSSKLEMMMDIEVDRMSNLNLAPEDLNSEREVVKEERRWRVDNNPMGLLMESVMSAVFKVSNYRWPVIGYMKDIADYKIETLRSFHNSFYNPNNAILVLAGDFKTADVRKLIEKHYGPLPSGPVQRRSYPKELPQESQRNASVKKDVQGTSFTVSYQGTPSNSAEMYPLDLAANILGNGSSSRLHKRLVYTKQSATSAYSYHSTMQDDGVFAVGVNMKPGTAMQESLELVYQEIWKMRNKLVTDEELQKAKTQVMKELVDGLTTADGKARALAVNEIVTGSYENLFKDLDRYNAVTAEQIKDAANKYLNQKQRSIVILAPKAVEAKTLEVKPEAEVKPEVDVKPEAEAMPASTPAPAVKKDQ